MMDKSCEFCHKSFKKHVNESKPAFHKRRFCNRSCSGKKTRPGAKITQSEQIKQMYVSGMVGREIAMKLNISYQAVYQSLKKNLITYEKNRISLQNKRRAIKVADTFNFRKSWMYK